MNHLNPQQRSAVTTIDRPLLVIAGAGSGKTRVITEKIAYLIRDCEMKASNIVAVTFTNKAAREMKSRVSLLLPSKQGKQVTACTFHSLGLSIIQKEHTLLGLGARFSIFDAADSKTLLLQILQKEEVNYSDKIDFIQNQISLLKNELKTPEQALKLAQNRLELTVANAYKQYEQYLRAYNAVDFDDLIRLPVHLFETNQSILDKWHEKIHYLLVDEYQDTNSCQYRLIQLLAGVRQAFTLVGDDDQSIYAWRGAKPDNLLQIKADFPRLEIVKLEQNYRSVERVLRCANQLISKNPHVFDKKLWSSLGEGELLRVLPTRNERDEVERVIADLQKHKALQGTNFSDYAILYRGNFQARVFEQALREQNIPYRITGQTSFFARTEVKDIMAYFKLLTNPKDDAAFLRIVNCPRREIGPATLEKLGNYAKSRELSLFEASQEIGFKEALNNERVHKRVEAFTSWICHHQQACHDSHTIDPIKAFLDELNYDVWLEQTINNPKSIEYRVKNIQDLVKWIDSLLQKQKKKSFAETIQHLLLLDILDSQQDEQAEDEVQLMTLHAAKGLEFNHVYIIGMEEEILPHKTSIELNQIEEERRLAYVGLTRAKKTLTMTFARIRKKYGERVACEPSRFLMEIPETDLHWEGNKIEYSEEETEQLANDSLAKIQALLAGTN